MGVLVKAVVGVFQSLTIVDLGFFLNRLSRDLDCILDRSSRCTMASHSGCLDEASR